MYSKNNSLAHFQHKGVRIVQRREKMDIKGMRDKKKKEVQIRARGCKKITIMYINMVNLNHV